MANVSISLPVYNGGHGVARAQPLDHGEHRRWLGEWASLMRSPILHTPYFNPLTAEESVDAYQQILAAFGD